MNSYLLRCSSSSHQALSIRTGTGSPRSLCCSSPVTCWWLRSEAELAGSCRTRLVLLIQVHPPASCEHTSFTGSSQGRALLVPSFCWAGHLIQEKVSLGLLPSCGCPKEATTESPRLSFADVEPANVIFLQVESRAGPLGAAVQGKLVHQPRDRDVSDSNTGAGHWDNRRKAWGHLRPKLPPFFFHHPGVCLVPIF